MFVNTFSKRLIFNFVLLFIFLLISLILFYQVYVSDTIIISFAVHPFNICEKYPEFWSKLKTIYVPISITSYLICINLLYSSIFTKKKKQKSSYTHNKNSLSLFIANNELGNPIILPEASLYQNILITGTIGSGKTSSAMYPFTKQLIKYNYNDKTSKLGMLILDVKGNYYSQVKKYAKYYLRDEDLIIIELRRKY